MASRAKRWLIGCGLGCLGLIVLAVAAAVGFGVWLRGSGELLEPQTLLGADTEGHVEWTLKLEDPGTEGFVRALIDALQALPSDAPEELPPWLYDWLERRQRLETERDLLDLFPLAVAWTMRPDETPDEGLHLFSVSVARLGNRIVFADWVLGWVLPKTDEVEVVRHRGERIYRIPLREGKRLTLFIRRGNLFFTTDLDTARSAIDRLIASSATGREATPLDRWFAETEQGGPMRGVVANDRGGFLRLWEWVSARSDTPADRALWSDIRGVTLVGGLREDGSLASTLRFHCPDAAWAAGHAPELVTALREGLAWTDLDPDLEARAEGDLIVVELRVPHLVDSIGHWLERAREIDTDRGAVGIDL